MSSSNNNLKLTMLMVLTVVLGLLSVMSLVLVLKVKNQNMPTSQVVQQIEQEPATETQPVEAESMQKESDELGATDILNDLIDLKLQDIPQDYSPSSFDYN